MTEALGPSIGKHLSFVSSGSIVAFMDCPICGSAGRVLESRQLDLEIPIIRRRRACNSHGHRYTSWESTHFPFVRKREGELVPFEEDKLRKSILAATASLPQGAWGKRDESSVVADLVEDINALAVTAPKRDQDALSTREIGRRVLDGLHQHDQTGIAHWRFATVFFKDRGFKTVEELDAAIKEEQTKPRLWVGKARGVGGLDGPPTVEPFSHTKLRRSLELAFSKTQHEAKVERALVAITNEARNKAEQMPDRPETDMEFDEDVNLGAVDDAGPRLVITSAKLGSIVLDYLLTEDHKFAYARFASAHKDYDEDFDSYVAEMHQLASRKADHE